MGFEKMKYFVFQKVDLSQDKLHKTFTAIRTQFEI